MPLPVGAYAPSSSSTSRRRYKNVVVGGVLPLALFCGGHNYFVSQLAQRNGWAPYSIHTTYQYAAAPPTPPPPSRWSCPSL